MQILLQSSESQDPQSAVVATDSVLAAAGVSTAGSCIVIRG
jgi:hypothetical protein